MNILLHGHHPLAESGLAYVGKNFINALLQLGHKVYYNVTDGEQLGQSIDHRKCLAIIPQSLGDLNKAHQGLPFDLQISIGDLWNYEKAYDLATKRALPWIAHMGCEGISYPDYVRVGNNEKIDLQKMRDAVSCFWHYTKASLQTFGFEEENRENKILWHCIEKTEKIDPLPLRALLGMPIGRPMALFIGDNIIRKGLDLFIKIIENNPNWIAYIHAPAFREHGIDLGIAASHLRYKQIWLREDLEKRLKTKTFTRAQILGFYEQANLFLHPHRGEGFGLCIADALNMSCPVLASDIGGPNEYLENPDFLAANKPVFIQMGGIGYWMKEPNDYQILPEQRERKPRNIYSFETFKTDLEALLKLEYQPKIWQKV